MSISSMIIRPFKRKHRKSEDYGDGKNKTTTTTITTVNNISFKIVPSKASTIRKKAKEKDDFPLPVLPQMPTYSTDAQEVEFLIMYTHTHTVHS